MTILLSRFVARDEPSATSLSGFLSEFSQGVQSEPGCVAYTVFRVQEDPTVLYIKETWATPEDADRHIRRAATDPDAQRALELLAQPIKTVTLLAV